VDTYEPRTVQQRAYKRGIASIHQTDSIVYLATLADKLVQNETQEYIEVEILSQNSWE
jgi:hypothetical protein